jgi:hypothetical protein
MDRVTARGAPFRAGAAAPSTGWDPHAVWRERVDGPRRRRSAADAPVITLADTSVGWDPLETWRLRVQGPRRTAR